MKSLCERQSKSFFCKFYQALFLEPLEALELQKLPWKSASRWVLDTYLHTPAHSPWPESPKREKMHGSPYAHGGHLLLGVGQRHIQFFCCCKEVTKEQRIWFLLLGVRPGRAHECRSDQSGHTAPEQEAEFGPHSAASSDLLQPGPTSQGFQEPLKQKHQLGAVTPGRGFSRKPQETCVLFLWLLQQPSTSFIMLPEAGTSSVSRPCLLEGSRKGAFRSPPPSPVSLASWQHHPNACL